MDRTKDGPQAPDDILSAELARRIANAALVYWFSRSGQDLAKLEALTRDAAAHVRRVGKHSADHFVLFSRIKVIADEVPSVGKILQQEGWLWPKVD